MFGASATFLKPGYGIGCCLGAQHRARGRGRPRYTNLGGADRARAPALHELGGADRDRTGGLLVANQALSQLSYSPLLALSFQPSAISRKLKAERPMADS